MEKPCMRDTKKLTSPKNNPTGIVVFKNVSRINFLIRSSGCTSDRLWPETFLDDDSVVGVTWQRVSTRSAVSVALRLAFQENRNKQQGDENATICADD